MGRRIGQPYEQWGFAGADCGVKGQFSISNVKERFQVQRANDSSEEFPIEMRERGKTLNYNAQLIHDLLPKH